MQILFISRKYPPVIGGMENYAYHLHQAFCQDHEVHEIILNKSQWHLLWFYPWIFIKGLYLLVFKKIDLVYVGDGVLVSVAWFFQSVFSKNTVLTIHGLDVIYRNSIYQMMVKTFLPRIKKIVANSSATKQAAIQRGVDSEKVTIIPVGVEWPEQLGEPAKAHDSIQSKTRIDLQNRRIITTIGRLVERKGVRWFVQQVVPNLDSEYCFLIAGDGPDKENIERSVNQLGLGDRVELLGRVSDRAKVELLQIADVFVSPNISIEGDMEGFGIVNLEAGTMGVPVVAAAVDGVKDAVMDGQTGYLVEEKNVSSFIAAIEQSRRLNRIEIAAKTKKNFGWNQIYQHYMELILG